MTTDRAGADRVPATAQAYGRFWKRLFDVVGAALALVVLAPLLAAIAVAVRLALGSPVIFRQGRPGLGGRPFVLLKFRTMTEPRDSSGRLLEDAERLNGFGRLLRRTSLDELPELVNIVKGDMSLVGPRPLLLQYLARYSPVQFRRHAVRPGLTGWAEVNGRNAISWEARFDLDVWYVDHVSFLLDLKILRRTVAKVLTGEGVSEPGHATRREFMGSAGVSPGNSGDIGETVREMETQK